MQTVLSTPRFFKTLFSSLFSSLFLLFSSLFSSLSLFCLQTLGYIRLMTNHCICVYYLYGLSHVDRKIGQWHKHSLKFRPKTKNHEDASAVDERARESEF